MDHGVMMNRYKISGFTLVELMITLLVFGIIVGLAAPSFVGLIEGNRVQAKSAEFLSGINMARSEAIKRGAPVAVQAVGGGFQDGWCVLTDPAAACGAAPAGVELRSYAAADQMVVSDGGVNQVVFDGRGFRTTPGVGGGVVVISVQPVNCAANEPGRRDIAIAVSGRTEVTGEDC
jgi:type IV fimbrial biogenesis protein FimT